MSGQSIQKKLYSAYGKVAKKLGKRYEIYRIDSLRQPISEENWLATVYGAFSSDNGFSSPLKSAGESVLAWINGQFTKTLTVQTGDFIFDHDTNECFVVDHVSLNKPITAIELPNRVSIYRSAYQDSGDGYQPEESAVVTNYPCAITSQGGQGGGFFIPAPTTLAAGLPTWQITLFAPANSIQSTDVLVDDSGNKSQIMTFNESSGMYTITTTSFHPQ